MKLEFSRTTIVMLIVTVLTAAAGHYSEAIQHFWENAGPWGADALLIYKMLALFLQSPVKPGPQPLKLPLPAGEDTQP